MKACDSCGHSPPKGARFCCQCGSELTDDAPVQAMAEAIKARGFRVDPDGTVSAEDLLRFKPSWTVHQLKRWRASGALPQVDPLSRKTRYALKAIDAFMRSRENF